jgi:hypothetical protein
MRQEAKADAAALRAEVDRLKKAAAAQEAQRHSAEAAPAQEQEPPRLDSLIVASFSPLFGEFCGKRFALLWRGSRDGFGAQDFHRRCDGRANTLTLILDTGGNVFGGFTPLEWESPPNNKWKCDDRLTSFLITLKNPHNIAARKFALKAEWKQSAIDCDSSCGPLFGSPDIAVSGNCNANTDSYTSLGFAYTNDTGLDGKVVFTGSRNFQVREIEVFEISDETICSLSFQDFACIGREMKISIPSEI